MIDTMISVYDVLDWYLITAIVVFAIGVLCGVRGSLVCLLRQSY